MCGSLNRWKLKWVTLPAFACLSSSALCQHAASTPVYLTVTGTFVSIDVLTSTTTISVTEVEKTGTITSQSPGTIQFSVNSNTGGTYSMSMSSVPTSGSPAAPWTFQFASTATGTYTTSFSGSYPTGASGTKTVYIEVKSPLPALTPPSSATPYSAIATITVTNSS